MKTQRTVQVGSESLSLETGHIAKQAHGACVVRLGDTVVLTTACMQASTMPRDFLHHPSLCGLQCGCGL